MQNDQQILETLKVLVQTLESIDQPIDNSPLENEIANLHAIAGDLINQKFMRPTSRFQVELI